jgi:hypothetical protein
MGASDFAELLNENTHLAPSEYRSQRVRMEG